MGETINILISGVVLAVLAGGILWFVKIRSKIRFEIGKKNELQEKKLCEKDSEIIEGLDLEINQHQDTLDEARIQEKDAKRLIIFCIILIVIWILFLLVRGITQKNASESQDKHQASQNETDGTDLISPTLTEPLVNMPTDTLTPTPTNTPLPPPTDTPTPTPTSTPTPTPNAAETMQKTIWQLEKRTGEYKSYDEHFIYYVSPEVTLRTVEFSANDEGDIKYYISWTEESNILYVEGLLAYYGSDIWFTSEAGLKDLREDAIASVLKNDYHADHTLVTAPGWLEQDKNVTQVFAVIDKSYSIIGYLVVSYVW